MEVQRKKLLLGELLELKKDVLLKVNTFGSLIPNGKKSLNDLHNAILLAQNNIQKIELEGDPLLDKIRSQTKRLLATWTEIETLKNSLVPDEDGNYMLTQYIKDRIDYYVNVFQKWEATYQSLDKKRSRSYKKEYKFFPLRVKKMKKDLNRIQFLCDLLVPLAAQSTEELQESYDNLLHFIKKSDLMLSLDQREISKADYYHLINYKLISYDLLETIKKTNHLFVDAFYKNNKVITASAFTKALIERSNKIDRYLATITIATSKNNLGFTEGQIQEKMDAYFNAYDGIKVNVVFNNKTYVTHVESPYFINNKKSNSDLTKSGKEVGNKSQLSLLKVGKGDPITIQKWLQKEINEDKKLKAKLAKIKDKDIKAKLTKASAILTSHMKDNKVGIDCSGFVSQFFNFIADKEGDMIYDKGDKFNPGNMSSTDLSTLRYGQKEIVAKKRVHKEKDNVPAGKQTFKKVAYEDVQVGDTLYYHNKNGTDHIRIVRDVQKVNEIIYYTIYESAGKTGPREMRWKYENKKLYQYTIKKSSGKWSQKKHEHFSRWTALEIPGGSTNNSIEIPFPKKKEEESKKNKKTETIKFIFKTSYLKKNDQPSAYSLITKVLKVSWSDVIKLNGEKKVAVIKDKESILLPKTAKIDQLKK